MVVIHLTLEMVQDYLKTSDYRYCANISKIHARFQPDSKAYLVEAKIPGSSTRQTYSITVVLREKGSILDTTCTCPVGYKCKHIYAVLCRICESSADPLPSPSSRRQLIEKQMERGEAVYIAFGCKSEMDSGSDFRRSYWIKDSFDQVVLGVFFSAKNANRCAQQYVCNVLGKDLEDDEEFSDDDEDEEECFCFDSSDTGSVDEDGYLDRVWVECRAIEDASTQFHP